MAGSWLTNSVVLNDNFLFDEQYYQVCQSPGQARTDLHKGGSCLGSLNSPIPDVWPITFSSLSPTDKTLVAPSLIATTPTTYSVAYSKAHKLFDKKEQHHTQITSGHNKADQIDVIQAAAASSAAIGFAASHRIISPVCELWECAYAGRNLALGFKLPEDTKQLLFLNSASMDSIDVKDMPDKRVMRIADGGAVDNSGIAQLVSYLQLNDLDNHFNIVAFDDIRSDDATDKTKYPSSDLSYLFDGVPGDTVSLKGISLRAPKLEIFKLNPAIEKQWKKYTWTVLDDEGQPTSNSLYYYTYEVETKKNEVFNIKAGSRGKVHVFASEFVHAGLTPENDHDFEIYDLMIDSFLPTLKRIPDEGRSNSTGLELLRLAFGLN